MAERNASEERVYDFIKENDGASAAEVVRKTKMPRSMVQNAFSFLLGEGSIYFYRNHGASKIYKIVKK